MKVTYMLSPTTPYVTHTQASNILSENLKRDQRIDPSFNMSILSLTMKILNEKNKVVERIEDGPLKYLCSKPQFTTNFLRILGGLYSNSNEFFRSVISTIKTDLVLITCWTIHSIPLIVFLLNNGKRVVMGGSLCNSYPIDVIRSLLKEAGTTSLKNIIIVKGYVGVQTDLYKIITDWKDIEIPEHDYTDMWCGSGDYIKKYLNLLTKCRDTDNTYYSATFNNNCWYNKCKFCKLREKNQPNFIREIDIDALYENIVENLITYRAKILLVNDNYFTFSEKNKAILKRLRKSGYKIKVLSGIISFMSESYLNDINHYVDEVGVGLESTSDFSLDYIIKGYKWSDIKLSVENMKKYLDRDKVIRYLVIVDLVTKNQNDIVQNYKNMAVMKNRLIEYGFEKIQFSLTPLQIFPSVGIAENTKYLKMKSSKSVSGMWYVYNRLRKAGVEVNLSEKLMMPFERYDTDGNLLLSDFEYISNDLIKNLF